MDNKNYFLNEVPKLIGRLREDHAPTFGIMTPQHMLEHLIWVTKSSIKDMGTPPDESELSVGQQKFMHFVKSRKPMEFRGTKDGAKLNDLRMPSLDAAKTELQVAVDRLLADLSSRGAKPYYNPMMGILAPDEMLSFHKVHFVHHLEDQYQLKTKAI